ncbi:MAG: hypothetical protein HFH75_15300 [Lachnospiraceae bacterium]|jgi:hypothetical protein|nr:hypothetical protein [Lachnospiraceae bacterium]
MKVLASVWTATDIEIIEASSAAIFSINVFVRDRDISSEPYSLILINAKTFLKKASISKSLTMK